MGPSTGTSWTLLAPLERMKGEPMETVLDIHEYVAGLRAVADWYEAHPEMPRLNDLSVSSVRGKEQLARIALMLPSYTEEPLDSLYFVIGDFQGVSVKFMVWRTEVCERTVVGKRMVEARVSPAHEEDIVEWKCHPLIDEDA